MDDEMCKTIKKTDEIVIELKKVLEQICEMRLRCAVMHMKLLASYQPLCLTVLDHLKKNMKEREEGGESMEE